MLCCVEAVVFGILPCARCLLVEVCSSFWVKFAMKLAGNEACGRLLWRGLWLSFLAFSCKGETPRKIAPNSFARAGGAVQHLFCPGQRGASLLQVISKSLHLKEERESALEWGTGQLKEPREPGAKVHQHASVVDASHCQPLAEVQSPGRSPYSAQRCVHFSSPPDKLRHTKA